MGYESLSKIYYKNSSRHEKIYLERFNAPTTKHFDFSIKQVGRQKSFPAFLCYTEELVLLIEKIYKQQENFLRIIPKVPPIMLEQFEMFCVVDEVKSTSDIEGVHSTRRELKEIIAGETTSPQFSSIIKKYSALIHGENLSFKTCEELRKFYDEFAHREVSLTDSSKKLDGKIFRKGSVDIQSATGKVLHRGIYPEEKIIEMMTKALQILNDAKIPTLIRIAAFHYFFEYIHPFYDGNGRTARFIASYFLSENLNYLAALRLSAIIKRQQKKYYNLFKETDAEINCGDLTPFVFGFISLVYDTLKDVENIFVRKLAQLERYRKKLGAMKNLNSLTLQIYDILLQSSLFFGRGVSMTNLMKLTGKSRNTIKSRIASDRNIFRTGKQKYFYKLNLKLFLFR